MDDVNAVNLALLALRVVVGVTFLAHGYNHVWGGGKIAGTARWFESLGMRPGALHAWLASLSELVGGSLLILGLLMPLAGGAVVGVMLVALVANHLKNGFFIFRPGEGYEYVLNLAVAGFALGVLGAGEWGLDHELDVLTGASTRLLVTLVAGVGGAAGLLAVFWRPERKAPAAEA